MKYEPLTYWHQLQCQKSNKSNKAVVGNKEDTQKRKSCRVGIIETLGMIVMPLHPGAGLKATLDFQSYNIGPVNKKEVHYEVWRTTWHLTQIEANSNKRYSSKTRELNK